MIISRASRSTKALFSRRILTPVYPSVCSQQLHFCSIQHRPTTISSRHLQNGCHFKRQQNFYGRRQYSAFQDDSYQALQSKPGLFYLCSFLLLSGSYVAFTSLLSLQQVEEFFSMVPIEGDQVNKDQQVKNKKVDYGKLIHLTDNPLVLYRLFSDKQRLNSVIDLALKTHIESSGEASSGEQVNDSLACIALLTKICQKESWCDEILKDRTDFLPLLMERINKYSTVKFTPGQNQSSHMLGCISVLRFVSRVNASHESIARYADSLQQMTCSTNPKVNSSLAEILVNVLTTQQSSVLLSAQLPPNDARFKAQQLVKQHLLKCAFTLTFSKHEKTRNLAYIACDMLIEGDRRNFKKVEELSALAHQYVDTFRLGTVISSWSYGAIAPLTIPYLFLTAKGIVLRSQGTLSRLPVAAIAKLGTKSALAVLAIHTFTHLCGYALLHYQTKGGKNEIHLQNGLSMSARSVTPLLIIPVFKWGYSAVVLSYLVSMFLIKQEPYSMLLTLLLGDKAIELEHVRQEVQDNLAVKQTGR